MILFGSSFSPFVRKVMVVAAEKGLDLSFGNVRIGDQNPECRTATPFVKMPACAAGHFSDPSSPAIVPSH